MKFKYFIFIFIAPLTNGGNPDCNSNDKLKDPLFFGFDEDNVNWKEVLKMTSGHCSEIGSAGFNVVRKCARANFYGPEGLKKMRENGKLYSAERNDMVLVLVSGCLKCAPGLQTNKGNMKISLVKYHPERSFFTGCKEEFQTMATIEVDLLAHQRSKGVRGGTPTTDSFPFIIAATFYERRCWGLFSADPFKMHHRSHFLRIENVHCGDSATQIREIPLGDIETEQIPDRAVEYIFWHTIDLEDDSRRMRINFMWRDPSKSVVPKPARKYDIDCARVFQNDTEYINERAKDRKKSTDTGEALSLGCDAIFARHHNFKPPVTDTEKQFPIAFVRTVYKDYAMLEDEFEVNYAPQNFYCFAIDKKASDLFHLQINSLVKCFPDNVFLLPREAELDMDSAGHNMNFAMLECMKILQKYNWEFVILLQNHDFQMRTNQELVQLLKWLDGANDIEYTPWGSSLIDFDEGNWTLAYLKLFSKELSKNDERKLEKNKGTSSACLTRAFVNWLIDDLDTRRMLDQLDSYRYATDEFFLSVLASNEFLEAPGGFTRKCYSEKRHAPKFIRFVVWRYRREYCRSGNLRHTVCLFGLEDLPTLTLPITSPFMFGNKMMPNEDDEALQCWRELMYNRTHLDRGLHRIANYRKYYDELPQVRYNRDKKAGRLNHTTFDCCYRFMDELIIGHGYEETCCHKKNPPSCPIH